MYIPALSVVLANEKFIYISYLLNGCFFLALIELTGCQAMGKVDFGEAFVDAAKDPMTWGNLAGAAILQVGNLDKKISDHAIKKTPVFGSKDKAVDMSTELKKYTGLSMQLSILLVDEGEGSWGRYLGRKTVRFLGNNLSGQFANAVAHELQPAFHRTRPDGSANGFPSCHSTTVFSDSWFARKKLFTIEPAFLSELFNDRYNLFGGIWHSMGPSGRRKTLSQ